MEVDFNVSEVKEFVQEVGGEVEDVGYESLGDYTKAFVYVTLQEDPNLAQFHEADNIEVDENWGPDMVLFEVTLNSR